VVYDRNTVFDFYVTYKHEEYTVEQIKDILIKCALENNFDIGIEAIETYELPEEIVGWIEEKE